MRMCLKQVLIAVARPCIPTGYPFTGDGYVAEMYKKYGRVISPMGCRAFPLPVV